MTSAANTEYSEDELGYTRNYEIWRKLQGDLENMQEATSRCMISIAAQMAREDVRADVIPIIAKFADVAAKFQEVQVLCQALKLN